MTPEPYEIAIEAALSELRTALDLLRKDITAYPTPISGCDQQYIRLMADRTRTTKAIQHLERMPFVATPRVLEEAVQA